MPYVLKTNLSNRYNYGGRRELSTIKYIVIHYTGNDGDSDENNGKYFKNNIANASAHYFVDDDSVTQSVPDDYTAWSVGGAKYKNTAGGSYFGKCTNLTSISVELCDSVKNGVVYPSAKTIENAIEFVRSLMKKYHIPVENVIRHYDVNGKPCPAYWCGTVEKDQKWKNEFHSKLVKAEVEVYRVRKDWNDVKFQIGAYNNLESAQELADKNPGYKVFNSSGEVVYTPGAAREVPFMVRVDIKDLKIRRGAGTNYKDDGCITPGAYTIVDVKSGKGSVQGWGKLKSGAGWISLDYVKHV